MKISTTFVIALATLNLSAYAAIRFHAVPTLCQRALTQIYAERDAAAVEIDWRPWVAHLRELGYAADFIPILLDDGPAPEATLRWIRNGLYRPEWTWVDGLTDADVIELAAPKKMSFEKARLEYLVHVPGFDPVVMAEAVVRTHADWSDARSRWLARGWSFWARSPRGLALAREIVPRIYDAFDRVEAHRWLTRALAHRGAAAPPLVLTADGDDEEHSLKDQENLLISLGHRPVADLAPADERRLARNWLRHATYPPYVDNGIEAKSFGQRDAYKCPDMSFGYLRVLTQPAVSAYLCRPRAEVPLVVRLNGRVIGLVKGEGNRSMLALRSVVNAEGHLTLMIGGVYRVPHALLETTQDRRPRRGPWPTVDLTALNVRALGPVLNEESWNLQNAPLLLDLIPNASLRQAILILGEAAREDWDMPLAQARRRLHRSAWSTVLARIDRLRRRLENEAAAGPAR